MCCDNNVTGMRVLGRKMRRSFCLKGRFLRDLSTIPLTQATSVTVLYTLLQMFLLCVEVYQSLCDTLLSCLAYQGYTDSQISSIKERSTLNPSCNLKPLSLLIVRLVHMSYRKIWPSSHGSWVMQDDIWDTHVSILSVVPVINLQLTLEEASILLIKRAMYLFRSFRSHVMAYQCYPEGVLWQHWDLKNMVLQKNYSKVSYHCCVFYTVTGSLLCANSLRRFMFIVITLR